VINYLTYNTIMAVAAGLALVLLVARSLRVRS
jgi:hypothetical protein